MSTYRKLLYITWFLGIVLSATGIVFNTILVSEANGGKMPVATKRSELLFTIGSMALKDIPEHTRLAEDDEFDNLHQPLKPEHRFPLLADRILIFVDFPFPENPSLWLRNFLALFVPTPGRVNLVSVGDMLIRLGDWMILISGILLFVRFSTKIYRKRCLT